MVQSKRLIINSDNFSLNMSDDDTLDPMDAIADEEESDDLGSDLDLDPEELKGLDKDEDIDADTR